MAASDRPLRVLLAPSAYHPYVGGIEEATRQLALALGARGHHVAVLTNRWPAELPRSEKLDGTLVTRLRFPLPAAHPVAVGRFAARAPAAAVALARHVRRWRPDVVHVIGAGPQSVYLAALHAWLGARLVFTAQGELTFDAQAVFDRSATLRAGLRYMLRHAHAVTACSAYAMRDLEALERPRCPTYVIPNGVDPDDFADASSPSDVDPDAPYVLAVGRLVSQKGFDVLIDAFASEALRNLTLLLAGDGIERRRLEARAAELGISPRVRFLGFVERSRLPQLLRGATVFAFPSRGEAFGIALLEAMAAGVPSVATATGGIPEFAHDGDNALLVRPEDPSALGSAIARIARDPELARGLSRRGRQTARELTWTRIAERYEAIYRLKDPGTDT